MFEMAAKQAARDAVQEYIKAEKRDRRFSSMAFYAWASIALLSTGIVALNIVVPKQSWKITATDGPTRLSSDLPTTLPAQIASDAATRHLDPSITGVVGDAKPIVKAPLAQEPKLGATLGEPASPTEIVALYRAIEQTNPLFLEGLSVRMHIEGTGEKARASLVVGPFASKSACSAYCKTVDQHLSIPCQSHPFTGSEAPIQS